MVEMVELTIPEELLLWASRADVEIGFAGPWGTNLCHLVKQGQDVPLSHRQTERLLSLVAAVCREAVRAGRAELVFGLDTFLAEWIGLSITIPVDGGSVQIGRGGRYTWTEMRSILATDDPRSALEFAEQAKSLLEESFPDIRFGQISDAVTTSPEKCASCGSTDAQVMLATKHGSHHCGPCWACLIEAKPAQPKKKAKR